MITYSFKEIDNKDIDLLLRYFSYFFFIKLLPFRHLSLIIFEIVIINVYNN